MLADDVDFRGLTPGRTWEGTGPDAVVETVFGSWFEPDDEIERVVDVAEQQVYYRGTDAIEHLRVMCSGFRPR